MARRTCLLLAAGLLALHGARCTPRGERPNILLVTLDTTRADRLGCYGSARETSPNLDRLARESVLYTRAVSPASWTLPGHASLFTGKFPSAHGAGYDPEGPLRLSDAVPGSEEYEKLRARGVAQGERMLAALLRDAGYRTAAVVAGPWMKRVMGLADGFDLYDDAEIESVNGRRARQVTEAALRFLDEREAGPFFLFLNYFDPHSPYDPPDGFARAFSSVAADRQPGARTPEQIHALYDAEILYMDHHVGRLLDRLESGNLYDDTWIIVSADHGELIGEHGLYGHGETLFEPELRIPLFMKYPRGWRAAERSEIPIQLVDVLPMICQALSLSIPPGIQGTAVPFRHPVMAETYPLDHSDNLGQWRALYQGDFKLLWNSRGEHRLHDLRNDPGELRNLFDSGAGPSRRMMLDLEGYLADLPSPGPASHPDPIDPETRKALEGLGYLR